MITVTHYGLHYAAGDIGFLLQRRSTQSIYGDSLPCPFEVNWRNSARGCPHAIDIGQADDQDRPLLEDPLVAWLAKPHGVAVIKAKAELLTKLSEMYSPIRPLIAQSWGLTFQRWVQEFQLTNVCPIILADATSKDMTKVHSVLSGQYPRPMLLLQTAPFPRLPGMQQLTTDLVESDLDGRKLRELGAWAVTERLRHKL